MSDEEINVKIQKIINVLDILVNENKSINTCVYHMLNDIQLIGNRLDILKGTVASKPEEKVRSGFSSSLNSFNCNGPHDLSQYFDKNTSRQHGVKSISICPMDSWTNTFIGMITMVDVRLDENVTYLDELIDRFDSTFSDYDFDSIVIVFDGSIDKKLIDMYDIDKIPSLISKKINRDILHNDIIAMEDNRWLSTICVSTDCCPSNGNLINEMEV